MRTPFDLSDPDLPRAADANYLAYWLAYADLDGSELRRDAGVEELLTWIPVALFNGVFGSSLPVADVAAAAAAVMGRAEAKGVPIRWRVTPTTPPGTADELERAGWSFDNTNPVMVIDAAAELPPPTDDPAVAVEVVSDQATLAEWSRVVALGFGFPEWALDGAIELDRLIGLPGDTPLVRILARVDGVPAASAAYLPGPDLGGIYSVATGEEYRGRGLGTAVTVAAVRHGRDDGATGVVLQASAMGFPVYERLGFATIGAVDAYLPPGATDTMDPTVATAAP